MSPVLLRVIRTVGMRLTRFAYTRQVRAARITPVAGGVIQRRPESADWLTAKCRDCGHGTYTYHKTRTPPEHCPDCHGRRWDIQPYNATVTYHEGRRIG